MGGNGYFALFDHQTATVLDARNHRVSRRKAKSPPQVRGNDEAPLPPKANVSSLSLRCTLECH